MKFTFFRNKLGYLWIEYLAYMIINKYPASFIQRETWWIQWFLMVIAYFKVFCFLIFFTMERISRVDASV